MNKADLNGLLEQLAKKMHIPPAMVIERWNELKAKGEINSKCDNYTDFAKMIHDKIIRPLMKQHFPASLDVRDHYEFALAKSDMMGEIDNEDLFAMFRLGVLHTSICLGKWSDASPRTTGDKLIALAESCNAPVITEVGDMKYYDFSGK